jgi:multiple sugar transport system permease protein
VRTLERRGSVGRQRSLPYLLVSAVVLYVGVVLLYPIGLGVYSSFTRQELLSGVEPRWIGLANYERLLRDARVWRAIQTTVFYTLTVDLLVLSSALGTALLLNNRFRFRWLARAVIALPWAFPEVAAVLVWTWMFSQAFGVLNVFARWLLPVPENLPWLTDPTLAFASIAVMTTWKIFPFYSLVLLTALQTVDLDLYEAARIDGAGRVESFWFITLPGIAPTLGIMTLLITIWSFRRFAIIYLMTGGGPAGATETLVVQVYNTAFKFFDLAYGATIGVVGLAMSLLITAAYFAAQRRLGMGDR